MPTAATTNANSNRSLISKQGAADLSTLTQLARGPAHFWVDRRGTQAEGWYWQVFEQHGLRQAWMHGPFATAKRAYNAARGL